MSSRREPPFSGLNSLASARPQEAAVAAGLGGMLKPDREVSFSALAEQHQLAGGVIGNVLRYCVLASRQEGGRPITSANIARGVRRELARGGKTA